MCLYNCVYILCWWFPPHVFICVWWFFNVFHSYILHIHENVAQKSASEAQSQSASLLSSEYFSSPMVGITSTWLAGAKFSCLAKMEEFYLLHQHLKLHVSATENDTE